MMHIHRSKGVIITPQRMTLPLAFIHLKREKNKQKNNTINAPFLFYNNRLHTYTSLPDCQFAQLMMASVEFGDVILSFFV